MKGTLVFAAVVALALARPETYKENEEFQYSRSSSADGYKSGSYAAQRGNVGGNYEKAHNMDTQAQQQMSGAIKNVEGELGAAGENNIGNVFTSANTRGYYNDRMYDLSNLQGRNFQEGANYYGNSHTNAALNSAYRRHSSQANSAYTAGQSAYNSQRYSGIKSDAYRQAHNANLEAIDQINSGNTNGFREFGKESGYSSEYRREGGYNGAAVHNHGQSLHASEDLYSGSSQSRKYVAAPVKIVLRPGSTAYVPIDAETYVDNNEARTSSSSLQQSSVNKAVDFVDTNTNHETVVPSGSNVKHYESNYKYHKEFESHDGQPIAAPVPLATPSVGTHELLDESASHMGSEYQRNHLASASQYDSQSASNSRYESLYNNHNNAYQSGVKTGRYNGALTNGIAVDAQPKRYESKYSYHKSWERQGDPYVIEPVASEPLQRLTAAGNQGSYSSYTHGSQSRQSHQSYTKSGGVDCDCDDDTTRVRRSAHEDQHEIQQTEDLTQQTQDLLQQSQSGWEDFGQSTHGKLEDLGQHTQDLWQNEDLTQQAQTGSNSYGHRTNGKIEELGQQTQDLWQQSEDLTQQSQRGWEDFSQQSQGKVDDFVQEHHNTWSTLNNFDQQNAWQQSYNQQNGHGSTYVSHNTDDKLKHDTFNEQRRDSENKEWAMHGQGTLNVRDTTESSFTPETDSARFPIYTQVSAQHEQHDIRGNAQLHNMSTSNDDFKPVTNTQNNARNDMRGLWDKIDNLSQQTLTGFDTDFNENTQYHTSQSGYQTRSSWQSGYGTFQTTQNNDDFRFHETRPSIPETTVKPETSSTEKPKPKYINTNRGRGDISGESLSTSQENTPKTEKPIYEFTMHDSKPYRTPEEIEALSLTRATEKSTTTTTEDTLSVVGINQDREDKHSLQEKINNDQQENTQQHSTISSANSNGYLIVPSYKNKQDTDQVQTTIFKNTEGDNGYLIHQGQVSSGHSYSQDNHRASTSHGQDFEANIAQVQQTTFEQQSEDLSQQSVNTWEDNMRSFEQTATGENSQRTTYNHETSYRGKDNQVNQMQQNENIEILEPSVNSESVAPVNANQDSTTTQKPGFWKSVGSKVKSWFKSS